MPELPIPEEGPTYARPTSAQKPEPRYARYRGIIGRHNLDQIAARTIPFAVKTTVAAVGVRVAAEGISHLTKTYFDGTNPPLSHDQATTDQGVYMKTATGGLVFVPNEAYLEEAKKLGISLKGTDGSSAVPIIIQQPETANQMQADKNANAGIKALTSPVTILVVAAGIALILFVKARGAK